MSTLGAVRTELRRRELDTLTTSFGSRLCTLLKDRTVTDIMLNGDGSLFVKHEGADITEVGTFDENDALTIINLLAALTHTTVGRKAPVIEAELPIRNGRFIGYVRPYVPKPSFVIRLPPSKLYTLDDYVRAGIATEQQAAVLRHAVRKKWNILVAGSTGAGKTTLLNAIIDAVNDTYPALRFGLIEEIIELQYRLKNVLALRTGPDADHQDLLKCLMRSRPEGIIIGEVRDKAALQLIKASNTGHEPVLSTVHANTAFRALGRLEDLCGEAVPGASFRNQIADAVGLVVGITHTDADERAPGEPERRITEIIKVEGVTNENYDIVKLA